MSATETSLTAAERIAKFACSFDFAQLNAAEVKLCGRSLADTYAVGVAGGKEHAPIAALRYLKNSGLLLPTGSPAPSAALWGRTERASPEVAAWWNGVVGHVLDYDDVTVTLIGHPSVVLWPALLAVAEARALDGQRLVAAFAVGLEVMCKLARGIAPAHYAKGWHATASIGAIGATVACSYLLALNAAQMGHAIGLAVAQVAGCRENVGTEAKSFQAGHACALAVRAASLAEAGFEAGTRALDGPHGYLRLYADDVDMEAIAALLASLGKAPLELTRSGLDVKQYPMCYATHRALDGVLALRSMHGVSLDDVARVEIVTSPGSLVPLVHPHPRSGLEGKFSMPYAMAAALADGAVRLTSFTDDAVLRPTIQRFFDHVQAHESEANAETRSTEITLVLHDGRRLFEKVAFLRGSTQLPLSDAELTDKIDDCLSWGGNNDVCGAALMECCLKISEYGGHALIAELQRATGLDKDTNGER